MNCQQVKHPWRILGLRTGSSRTQDCLPRGDDFGLHEQVAERRVRCIGGVRREHHLRIAGDFNGATGASAVIDVYAPHLDRIFGRRNDFSVRIVIKVAASKFSPAFREDGLVRVCLPERWLMRIGPEYPAGSVADITEGAPIIAGRVLAPSRYGEVLPAAVAAAGIGHHQVVMAIG